MTEKFAYDAFISYTKTDENWVEKTLLPRLESAGVKVFVEFRDQQPGADRILEIQRAVETSAKTLVVLSPDYLKDEARKIENLLTKTLDPAARDRRLIPLMKTACEPPLYIAHLSYVNFARPDRETIAWRQLLAAFGIHTLEDDPTNKPTNQPPSWFLAHPYGMPPNFTGRVAERARLTSWLEGRNKPALVVRALGGFGKSALTWHWLLHDVDRRRWPHVVWWSFYETQASFETFLRETLDYFFQQGLTVYTYQPTNKPTNQLTPRQQIQILLGILAQPGTLLILDGFERELRAYSGLSAAYQGDEPQTETPTPHSHSNSFSHAYDRDCTSPLAEHFLRSVASLPHLQSKVLLTTRLRPKPLEAHGGVLLTGCDELELTSLHPEDAVTFFRAQGIRGSRAEIQAACAPYGYHPLSLRLLAGLVLDDFQQPGDIAAAGRLDVTGNLVQRQHHVLETAYTALDASQQKLLSTIACFRGSVNYEAIQAIAQQGGEAQDGKGETVSRPYKAGENLRVLISRGLLHHDRAKNTYDLHPIVRRYAYDRLTGDARTTAHARLRDYFEAVPKPEKVARLEDLEPLIELYHHIVRAGQYDEARTFFRDRLE
ncbi:MAG: toll/interleukin-1 receptor domain-containing protein, partial [Anaerolineales bacterium]|nr:toll/interleukin-1 receptor domain-containing protein [Anaerolineales bacterium]